MIHNAQSELFLVLNDADLDALYGKLAAARDNEENAVSISIVLTGERGLDFGHVVRHPPLESELHGLTDALVVVADSAETLVASAGQGNDGHRNA